MTIPCTDPRQSPTRKPEDPEKKKLLVYPIMFGRAKLLLGLVKAGSAKKAVAKRGPGRPKGSKNKRGPGRPRKVAARSPGRPWESSGNPLDAIRDLLGSMKESERESAQLRSTLEKIRGLIRRAV